MRARPYRGTSSHHFAWSVLLSTLACNNSNVKHSSTVCRTVHTDIQSNPIQSNNIKNTNVDPGPVLLFRTVKGTRKDCERKACDVLQSTLNSDEFVAESENKDIVGSVSSNWKKKKKKKKHRKK